MYQLYGSLSSFALCWARTRLFQLGESEISFDARRLIHLYNMGECEPASDTLIVAVLDGHTRRVRSLEQRAADRCTPHTGCGKLFIVYHPYRDSLGATIWPKESQIVLRARCMYEMEKLY
jgi:hypothetical protein